MHFGIISLFPEMFTAVTGCGVTGRAVERAQLRVDLWNPREYTLDRHRTVDDRPYGGGPGMVMMYQPLADCVAAARQAMGTDTRVAYLSPQGRALDQAGVIELAGRERLILVAGRYEGVDERFVQLHVDEEWSIGDYVLSGGELAAMVIIDAVARQLPGVLGHEDSAAGDSFANGLLDHPHYTRPETAGGRRVPQVLLDGHHEQIRRWRMREALRRTAARRPDLLRAATLDDEQRALLDDHDERG